ncbi:hypothetical protein MAJ_11120, partial [Metarhizium majus ARSEF 297]
MFQHVSIRHIPALYFAFANCVGAVLDTLSGPRSLIELYMYELPPAIANVPETWPVWRAGQARIILLGLLMHVFYWRPLLGINDCMVVWHHGDKIWAWIRLFGSFAFGAAGFFGLAQGPGAKNNPLGKLLSSRLDSSRVMANALVTVVSKRFRDGELRRLRHDIPEKNDGIQWIMDHAPQTRALSH